MNTATCFSPDQLRSYLLGNIPDQQYSLIEDHLQQCVSCEESLAALDDTSDSLVRHLHSPAEPSRYESDQSYQEAIGNVRQLRIADSTFF